MSKWIFNDSGAQKVYSGQTMADQTYYEIQSHEEITWANNSALLTDIGNGDAIVSNLDNVSNHITDVSTAINYLKGALPQEVTNRPSVNRVSLRIEGDTWACPANTSTTHYVPLNDDYEMRGAEFQFVNGKAGDYMEVWVTDKDGIIYPAGTQLTKYINKFCVFEHTTGSQAPVCDLVDDDTSDLIPSILYLEFKYTNNQPSGADVQAVVNFWMYKRV